MRPSPVDPMFLRAAFANDAELMARGINEDGVRAYWLRQEPDYQVVTLTDEDLAKVNPALLPLVHYRLGEPNVYYGTDIFDSTLAHMEEQNPTMFNVSVLSSSTKLVAVSSFYKVEVDVDTVTIGVLYRTQLGSDGPTASFYLNHSGCVIRTDAFMDQHYPDWQSRYKVAEELGLDKRGVANFVMQFERTLLPAMSAPSDTLPSF